jgi:hypothetical protein
MKILCFAPHADIWVHSFPEALVAEAIAKAGHDIVYVSCGRQLNRHCVAMSANGIAPSAPQSARDKVCDRCESKDRLLRREFKFAGPKISDLITKEDEGEIAELIERMTPEQIQTIQVGGFEIGRLALYQIILRHKRLDLDFTEQEWNEYLIELRNVLYSVYAGRKLMAKHCPDRVLVYNGLYAVNRAISKIAESRNIPAYFLHAGGNLSNRLQTLMLGRGDTFRFMPHLIAKWPQYSNLPCSAKQLSLVTDHYIELLRARSVFVYSKAMSKQPFDLRTRFKVTKDQKILVATMGSYDEEVAAEMVGARKPSAQSLFPTQIEWIQALISFVTRRPDLYLIVRVHPREFPNKRDRTLSQHAKLLREVFNSLPSNVAINWPDDDISMYDLAGHTDVFLNSWSSVGKEMSLLGIPVVIYSPDIVFYPPDLNYVGTTQEEYFRAIDDALKSGWSLERVRQTYRWSVFEFHHALIHIGDSYSGYEYPNRSIVRRVSSRLLRTIFPLSEEHLDCLRRRPRLASANKLVSLIEKVAESPVESLELGDVATASSGEETEALLFELGRVAAAMYPEKSTRINTRLYRAISEFSSSTMNKIL